MSFLEMVKGLEAKLRQDERDEENIEREKRSKEFDVVNEEKTPPLSEALPYLAMPLNEFQARGALLEVRVPGLDVTLWMVPTERDATALMREDVSRGRIWTARELIDLLAIPGATEEQARTIAVAKLEFDGEVVEVRAPRPGDRPRGAPR